MTEPPQRRPSFWTGVRVFSMVSALVVVAYCLIRLATGHDGTDTWIPLLGFLLVIASTLWDSRQN